MNGNRGTSLVELLVAMAVFALLGVMMLSFFEGFQAQARVEQERDVLHDRAERLISYLAREIRDAAFLTGPSPRDPDNNPLRLTRASLADRPLVEFAAAMIPLAGDDDSLVVLKGVSFSPKLRLQEDAEADSDLLVANRRLNQPPGSTRELLPAPDPRNWLCFASGKILYPVVDVAGSTLCLGQPLVRNLAAGNEIFGLRALAFKLKPRVGSNWLVRDDFVKEETLDKGVDGLQFQYLTQSGDLVDEPPDPAVIRGVKVGLLIRAERQDRDHLDQKQYPLGNRRYGPYRDHCRRMVVERLVEVKNNGLQ